MNRHIYFFKRYQIIRSIYLYAYILEYFRHYQKLVEASCLAANEEKKAPKCDVISKTASGGKNQLLTDSESDLSQEIETVSGFESFGHYDSHRMRQFINEDPIGFAGGINFYTFVDNNPVNYTDPYGLVRRTNGIIDYDPVGMTKAWLDDETKKVDVEFGYIYTDKGRQIRVYKNVLGIHPEWNSNCHGYTFADGEYWVFSEDVHKIIEDEYEKQTSIPEKGNIILYQKDVNRKNYYDHSNRVAVVTKNKTIYTRNMYGPKSEVFFRNAKSAFTGTGKAYKKKKCECK